MIRQLCAQPLMLPLCAQPLMLPLCAQVFSGVQEVMATQEDMLEALQKVLAAIPAPSGGPAKGRGRR